MPQHSTRSTEDPRCPCCYGEHLPQLQSRALRYYIGLVRQAELAAALGGGNPETAGAYLVKIGDFAVARIPGSSLVAAQSLVSVVHSPPPGYEAGREALPITGLQAKLGGLELVTRQLLHAWTTGENPLATKGQ